MHVKKIIFCISTLILILISIFVFIFVSYFFQSQKRNEYPPIDFNLSRINLYQKNNVFIQKEEWNISIPKLNLEKIPIKDSIEEDILECYIGHFPISSYFKGNVCLAAHNSGFIQNYFRDINQLQYGDEIIYSYYNNFKTYCVIKSYIMDENDFSFLNLDNKDKLTLITCVTGSPSKRLCVEAECKE